MENRKPQITKSEIFMIVQNLQESVCCLLFIITVINGETSYFKKHIQNASFILLIPVPVGILPFPLLLCLEMKSFNCLKIIVAAF